MIPSSGPTWFRGSARFTTVVRRRHSSSPPLAKRPSIAPKPCINIKHIRENPERYTQTCIDRNYIQQKDHPRRIIQLFDQWKHLQRNVRNLRQLRNEIRTKLAQPNNVADTKSDAGAHDRDALLAEAKRLKEEYSKIESQEAGLNDEIESLATDLPNLTSKATPIGKEPRVLGYINEAPNITGMNTWRNHVCIGNAYDLLDFTGAATTSGWGWYYLKNEGALLEQALVQYALSVAMKHGFSVVSPPSMVYSHIAEACGFQPRDQGGEQQSYLIAQNERRAADETRKEGKPEMTMAGTAEIPFAGMKANRAMDESELPLYIVGASRCYRAEAGARGLDTKGLYRVHEFTKVEMFAWTIREKEQAAFDAMLAVQKEILESLGLHCRILEMPSTDLGASAVRKIDIEGFFPSRQGKDDGWGEVTSVSICTDYQTRRLNTRVDLSKRVDGESKTVAEVKTRSRFPSTVNGTAVAVPRVLAALVEKGWDAMHECIEIPRVLWPWMHGTTNIRKKSD
ncbi:MAG: hypothetical protein Q9201_006595 [Fulgogasparrea decipioides]